MFGKSKLMRDGAEAQGVIVDSDAGMALTAHNSTYRVTVRVHFDDGTTVDVERKLHTTCGIHTEGFVVPVRYDAVDRSKIEIDEPVLEARQVANAAEMKRRAIERGERTLGEHD